MNLRTLDYTKYLWLRSGVSTAWGLFVSFLPLWVVILFTYLSGQDLVDPKLLWSSVLYASFALSLVADARLKSLWRFSHSYSESWRRPTLLFAPALIMCLVVTVFTALWAHAGFSSEVPTRLIPVIVAVTVLSVVHHFLVDTIDSQEFTEERQRLDLNDYDLEERTSKVPPQETEADALVSSYINAVKWSIGPLSISLLITSLTYYAASYQGTIINHATIFGVYLAVSLVFKQKVDESLQKETF